MARIDTMRLVAQVGDTALRANEVRQDPAVEKKAHEAWGDIQSAARSVAALGFEVGSAWRRTESHGRGHRGPAASFARS